MANQTIVADICGITTFKPMLAKKIGDKYKYDKVEKRDAR